MLPVDFDIREEILNTTGNIIISASAGTGKTYTTVQRIIKDINDNKSHQTYAAITFTRKAAREIINRLGPKKGEGFVGTNDNFIRIEIIQPFMYDVYGIEFKKEIKPDYSNENTVDTFEEGINKINDMGLLCKYKNPKKNFAFELGLEILRKSHSCKRYLKSRYYRIYIDEYQDSDVDMHKFFMYLTDEFDIPLFIVGDEKQSIYSWRGAYSDGFKEILCKENFTSFELSHNFRSNKVIQNYSNIFMANVRKNYQKTDFNNEIILYRYQSEADAIDYIDNWLDRDKSCSFLHFSNQSAQRWSELLCEKGINMVFLPGSPLDKSDIESEHIWIARGIAHYILQNRYSEYDFLDDAPMPETYSVFTIRDLLANVRESKHDFNHFKQSCKEVYKYLGYNYDSEKVNNEIAKLFDVVNKPEYIPTYNQDIYKHKCGTIHSSKGLEYKQVIINACDFDLHHEEPNFLHYVAITRPEERLLIIGNGNYYKRYKRYIEQAVKETKALGKNIDIVNVIKIIE